MSIKRDQYGIEQSMATVGTVESRFQDCWNTDTPNQSIPYAMLLLPLLEGSTKCDTPYGADKPKNNISK